MRQINESLTEEVSYMIKKIATLLAFLPSRKLESKAECHIDIIRKDLNFSFLNYLRQDTQTLSIFEHLRMSCPLNEIIKIRSPQFLHMYEAKSAV